MTPRRLASIEAVAAQGAAADRLCQPAATSDALRPASAQNADDHLDDGDLDDEPANTIEDEFELALATSSSEKPCGGAPSEKRADGSARITGPHSPARAEGSEVWKEAIIDDFLRLVGGPDAVGM